MGDLNSAVAAADLSSAAAAAAAAAGESFPVFNDTFIL